VLKLRYCFQEIEYLILFGYNDINAQTDVSVTTNEVSSYLDDITIYLFFNDLLWHFLISSYSEKKLAENIMTHQKK